MVADSAGYALHPLWERIAAVYKLLLLLSKLALLRCAKDD
jgi:hypothetical protein